MPHATSSLRPITRALGWYATCAGIAAAGIGAFHLVAWWAGRMTYRGLQGITMKTNTAVCLVLCGVALALVARHRPGKARRLSAQGLVALAMVIGLLTLLEHLLGVDFGIDQFLAQEPPGALAVLHPNRMGPPAALSFVLGGAAILLLLQRREAAWRLAQTISILLCLIPLLGLLGYLFGAEGLYGVARITGVALPTTVALILLGTGILCARPASGLMSRVTSPDPGGAAIRRLLPAALVLPVALGWLSLLGERNGVYDRLFGTCMLVLSWIIIFSILVYLTGSWITRSSEALQGHRRLVEGVLNALPVGVKLMRGSGLRTELANPAYQAIAPVQETPGRYGSWTEKEGDLEELCHRVQSTGEARHAVDQHCLVRRYPDGPLDEAYFSWSLLPVDLPEDPLWGVLAIAWETTDRKRAEEKLRVSEEKFAKAFTYNTAGMSMMTLDDGRFLEVNATWLAIFGYRRDEVIGRTSQELNIWPSSEDRERVIEQLRAQRSVHNLELRLRRRSGENCVILSSAEIVIMAGVQISLWSVVDITDRKRAEEALREREQQLHLFIEHAPAALAMFDREMRYLNASRHWNVIYDLGSLDLRGRSHYEIFPEIPAQWREFHRRGLAGEILSSDADRFVRADGSVQWIRWELRPWNDAAGNVGGIVIFTEDMTVLKRAEESLRTAKDQLELRVQERTRELEQTYARLHRETEERLAAVENLRRNEQVLLQQSRLAAMGEMLGNIAHQWRQPLNTLGLLLQHMPLDYRLGQLNEQYLDGAVSKAMQLILHMSQTIDDFRGFLLPEREKTRFSVNEAVATTLSLFEATLKTMAVDLHVSDNEQLFVDGYRNEFCQVIMNLITNSRDAFKERGITSPMLAIELSSQEGKSVVTFTDNAGGIPEEIMDRIFDPYFTTKGPDKGTGIGLFMSKNIIEKSMNGSLTVRNIDGGAEFRIAI